MKKLSKQYDPQKPAVAVRLPEKGQPIRVPVEFLAADGEVINTGGLSVEVDLLPEKVVAVLESLAAETVNLQQEAADRQAKAKAERDRIKNDAAKLAEGGEGEGG